MKGAIFVQIMRRSLYPLLFWGSGAALVAYAIVIIVPSVESLQQMAKFAETLPPFLLEAFGGSDVKFFATPEGYLSINLFSWMMPVLGAFSILAGLGVTANEEDTGILDVLISQPLPRWQIVIEKTLGYGLIVCLNVVMMLVGLWLGISMTPSMSMNLSRVSEATLNQIPSLLLILTFTILVGTLVRRRNVAAGLASLFLIAGYLIDLIGRAARGSIWDSLRVVSFYNYHDNPGVMMNGLNWGNILLLSGVSLLFLIGAVWLFERRNVGV